MTTPGVTPGLPLEKTDTHVARDEEKAADDHPVATEAKSPGVVRIEAVSAGWKPWHRWAFFVSLFVTSYVVGLDGMTHPTFQAVAISLWNRAANVATLNVIRAAIGAISQPIFAKLADYYSRTAVVIAAMVIFTIGNIVQATANGFNSYIGGNVVYNLGFGGQFIITLVLLSDLTTLRSRLVFLIVPSLPFIINAWVSGTVAQKILADTTWRWGFGWVAIAVPIVFIPLLSLLFIGEHQGKKLGLLDGIPSMRQLLVSGRGWVDFFWQADVVGILWLSATVALVLIPITLGGGDSSKWKTAEILAPLIIGVAFALPMFILWEKKWSKHPMVPSNVLWTRHVLCSLAIPFIGTITTMVQGSYLIYLLLVAFGKSVEAATQVANIGAFVSAVIGFALGLVVRKVRRVKPFIIAGAAMQLLAFGLLVRYRGGHNTSDFAGLVGAEVVLGFGYAFVTYPTQVGLQAVVKHEHLGIFTALFQVCFQVGAGVGAACAGAIFVNTFPGRMMAALAANNIPAANAAKLAETAFGNPILYIIGNPVGTPARAAIESAYRDVQRYLGILGCCLSALMVLISLCLDNPLLPDRQESEAALEDTSQGRVNATVAEIRA